MHIHVALKSLMHRCSTKKSEPSAQIARESHEAAVAQKAPDDAQKQPHVAKKEREGGRVRL